MTLKEQLLSELRQQNEIDQEKIKKLEEDVRNVAYIKSTITGGLFATTARSSCERDMQAANAEKARVKQKNAWISEMLSNYK